MRAHLCFLSSHHGLSARFSRRGIRLGTSVAPRTSTRNLILPACRVQGSRVAALVVGFAASSIIAATPCYTTLENAQAALADSSSAPLFAQSTTHGDNTPELREQSRRNSRASGKASQLFATARRQAAAGEIAEALSSYNNLVDIAPAFAPARSNRANILVAQEKFEDALLDYNAALELAPLSKDAWVVLVNRGCTYMSLQDYSHALEDFNAAANHGNGDPTLIFSNRAACYEALEKWDMALRDYQRALEADASEVQPWWIRYALVLFERGRTQDSLGILRRISTRYDASDVHAALAAVYFSRGDVESAEAQWSKVDRPKQFSSKSFLSSQRKWPPRAIDAIQEFRTGVLPAKS